MFSAMGVANQVAGSRQYAPPVPPPREASSRVASIDILRGLVVVLMAIDHVRVFSAVPAGGPDPGVFFTRWVTHFVAPVFVFLAGTAAFLYGNKVRDRSALARFLVTRGLLLILLELTVIRVSWTFNLDYGTYMLAGVIWVIGWSMILLAAFAFLPVKAVGAVGVSVILLHNLIPWIETENPLLKILYYGGAIELGGSSLVILYTLIPWVGVMAAGYAFGALFTLDAARRRRILLTLGGVAVALFVLLRATGVYGDPNGLNAEATGAWPNLRSFLNTSKYPASLQFLLMTLGPALLALPFLEQTRGPIARVLETFGRVPMFYYLLHIPLIHLLAVVVSLVRTGSVTPWLFGNHPMWPPEPPPGYRWSLTLLYAITVVAVVILYFACRWYAQRKATNPRPWMKYI
jgi:uncharacterized membrane protein